MNLQFKAIREDEPGEKWRAHFARVWPDYERWFLQEGEGKRPGYLSCLRALKEHMPELVETWERLSELAGGSDLAARMLALYCPPPFLTGCSQAIWTRGEPALIRNYDFHPASCEALILCSQWNGTRTLASSDCLWGALDGINEHGLAVALAFGGRRMVGTGFGIPLILRYLLEFCEDVPQAVEALERIPCHMSYTVGLVDSSGESRVVYLNPDRPTEVRKTTVFTNHQDEVHWPEYAENTRSLERHAFLAEHHEMANESLEQFTDRFLKPPLHTREYAKAFGTLYTAVYRPSDRSAEFKWPAQTWHQSLDNFVEGASVIEFS